MHKGKPTVKYLGTELAYNTLRPGTRVARLVGKGDLNLWATQDKLLQPNDCVHDIEVERND